jgi:hypothetical protein
MTTSELGKYLQQLIKRHPRLSMRQASIKAGLNENAVQQIITGHNVRPRPATLKAITDTWGTPKDYFELLRLAGHDTTTELKTPEEAELLVQFRKLSDDIKSQMVEALKTVNRQTSASPDLVNSLTVALRAGDLSTQGQLAILDMIEHILRMQQYEKEMEQSKPQSDPSAG